MKKSLVKKLVRMAKDGDPEAIEAMAELLEEVSEAEVIETKTYGKGTQKRYALKAKTSDGRNLTTFVSKDTWEAAKKK